MITLGSIFLTIGPIPMAFLILTVLGVLGIILHRTIWCRFWRSEDADRRKVQAEFDGVDRRRRERRDRSSQQ